MHYQQARRNDISAWALSLAFHILLLLGAYYWIIRSSAFYLGKTYRIQLSRQSSQQEPITSHLTGLPNDQPIQEPIQQPIATNPRSPVKAPASTDQEVSPLARAEQEIKQPTQVATEGSVVAESVQAANDLDERGLYTGSQAKQAGASLELVGWVWDATPQVQDTTAEIGRLVFEITIDDLGEIMAVKTLEKTVSPLVEQIYKDAVAKLTFSKTTDNRAQAPMSVGKVTFIIQAR